MEELKEAGGILEEKVCTFTCKTSHHCVGLFVGQEIQENEDSNQRAMAALGAVGQHWHVIKQHGNYMVHGSQVAN